MLSHLFNLLALFLCLFAPRTDVPVSRTTDADCTGCAGAQIGFGGTGSCATVVSNNVGTTNGSCRLLASGCGTNHNCLFSFDLDLFAPRPCYVRLVTCVCYLDNAGYPIYPCACSLPAYPSGQVSSHARDYQIVCGQDWNATYSDPITGTPIGGVDLSCAKCLPNTGGGLRGVRFLFGV